jgi:hypothetical protein
MEERQQILWNVRRTDRSNRPHVTWLIYIYSYSVQYIFKVEDIQIKNVL